MARYPEKDEEYNEKGPINQPWVEEMLNTAATNVVVVVVAVEANRLTLGTYSGNCLETHTRGFRRRLG